MTFDFYRNKNYKLKQNSLLKGAVQMFLKRRLQADIIRYPQKPTGHPVGFVFTRIITEENLTNNIYFGILKREYMKGGVL